MRSRIAHIVFTIAFLMFRVHLSMATALLPGDDKKGKVKREDTTRFVLNRVSECEDDELPDTLQFLFPSHDLYSSWDVNVCHPYNFSETFKEDSVIITLVNAADCGFVLPFRGHLTSLFGWRKYLPHYGTDIDLNTGDPVLNAFDGMVRLAKYVHGYGYCVIVRHRNGLETVYAHLSKILVESGQILQAGNLVGLGGNTGRSTGSHLHFEIRYLGQAIDTQDLIDFEKGTLRCGTFVFRKADVENKYDLRAMHNRHRMDVFGRAGKSPVVNGFYYVHQGDNLWLIARRCGSSVQQLCKKNKLKPGVILRIGQRIRI
jgi:hypothetical protein